MTFIVFTISGVKGGFKIFFSIVDFIKVRYKKLKAVENGKEVLIHLGKKQGLKFQIEGYQHKNICSQQSQNSVRQEFLTVLSHTAQEYVIKW